MTKEAPDLGTIGGRLHAAREELGLTLISAAKCMGVSYTQLKNWEATVRTNGADAFTMLDEAGADIGFIVTGKRTPQRLANVTVREALAIMEPEARHALLLSLLADELRK